MSLVYFALAVAAVIDLTKREEHRWFLKSKVHPSNSGGLMWMYLVVVLLLMTFRNDFPFNLIVLMGAAFFLGFCAASYY